MRHGRWALGLWLFVSACGQPGAGAVPVRPGIEVLLADSLHLVSGRRLGILTNQTGVDRAGTSDVDLLVAAGLNLTAIFSPEHGYRGALDRSDIGHGIDSATGTPIYSLYGAVRAPTDAMLDTVDAILVDLQDIGARPYTFISTTLLTMRAARARGVAVIVLDRPNPIGGRLVQGPVLDTALSSFVGMLPVAMRHGMTSGELARFGNDRLGIGADLTVVPAAGWARDAWFDATGLPWVRPSPNMPDLESATHYPGTVVFEATNLSVGRGTPVAFQVLGAPWLDAGAMAAAVSDVPGVVARDTVVTPEAPPDGKYHRQAIPAVRLLVTDRARYDPVVAAIHLLVAVRARHPDSLAVRPDRLARLAGSAAVWRAVERGEPVAAIVRAWRDELDAFRQERAKYLLYP